MFSRSHSCLMSGSPYSRYSSPLFLKCGGSGADSPASGAGCYPPGNRRVDLRLQLEPHLLGIGIPFDIGGIDREKAVLADERPQRLIPVTGLYPTCGELVSVR